MAFTITLTEEEASTLMVGLRAAELYYVRMSEETEGIEEINPGETSRYFRERSTDVTLLLEAVRKEYGNG